MHQLVSGEGGQTLLTAAEKQRLAELLEEMDEEDVDSARGADREVELTSLILPLLCPKVLWWKLVPGTGLNLNRCC